MRKHIQFLLAVLVASVLLFGSALGAQNQVSAQTCTYSGQCLNNQKCYCSPIFGCQLSSNPCGSALIGGVEPPKGVAEYNQASGGSIGILLFASRIILILNIGAGLFVMYNFLIAGLTYVTSAGDTGAHQKVRDKLIFSFVGIAVIISAYTAAGLIGLVFFGDAAFILNPQLQGAL